MESLIPYTLDVSRSIDGVEIRFLNRGAPSHSGGRPERLASQVLTWGGISSSVLVGLLALLAQNELVPLVGMIVGMVVLYSLVGVGVFMMRQTEANRFESLRLSDRALQIFQTERRWSSPLEDVIAVEIHEDPTPTQGNQERSYIVVRSAGGEELTIEAILNDEEADWLKAAIEGAAAYRREVMNLAPDAEPGRPPPELVALMRR